MAITDHDDPALMPNGPNEPGAPMSRGAISLLTLFLIILYGALIYVEIGLWWEAGDSVQSQMKIDLPWRDVMTVSGNSWMLILILVTGAVGSFVHAATSLADFVGNRKSARSWTLWYLLRPLIGSALALVFYLLLRGGLFNGTNVGPQVASFNPYGFAAVAAMAGMFAKQATDKLNEVFDALFRTVPKGGDNSRSDPMVPSADPPPHA